MTRWHRLSGVVERCVILEGEGLAEIGDSVPERVGPGSVVVIPAGVPQRITNAGKGDVVFLAVCTPRFRPEIYRDIAPCAYPDDITPIARNASLAPLAPNAAPASVTQRSAARLHWRLPCRCNRILTTGSSESSVPER